MRDVNFEDTYQYMCESYDMMAEEDMDALYAKYKSASNTELSMQQFKDIYFKRQMHMPRAQ